MKYRVTYIVRTYLECHVDVEADNESSARQAAERMVEASDDALQESPDTYHKTVEPSGDVEDFDED